MANEDKKNPKEASNIFHSIMKAFVTPKKTDKEVVCCFCGNGESLDNAINLNIIINSEESQGLYCHSKCLHRVLHKSIPLHPDL
jgi:hypothetical protein